MTEVAVILPLEDPRGDIVEHIATWTRGQTLPRDRYQVVVSANGEHPDFERGVAELLAPQDQLVVEPGASFVALYGAAAQAARAPVLLLTEAHVRAEPELLAAVADVFAEDPELDIATFKHRQSKSNVVAELTERWIARAYEAWEEADWTRLNFAGSAVRAEAWARAGGLDPRLGLYATSLMSALLDEQGARSTHLDDAAIIHELEEEMGEALAATRSFTQGECLVRGERDPEFCERYFGPAGWWGHRLGYRPENARAMASALISAVRRSPRDARWLTRELVVRLPALVAGARPRWAWERAMAGWHTLVAGAGVVPMETRWRSCLAAHQRSIRAVRLREGPSANGLAAPPAATGVTLGAERLDDLLVGAHGLERQGGRRFRWTEPVALLRLALPADGAVLRVRTGGLRGAPLDYLQGIYAAGLSLPPANFGGDEETLEVRLPPNFAKAAADSGVVMVCRPFLPSRAGSSDRRRLGMPVVELSVDAL